MGSLSLEDDPDVYDKGFLHCDLLITGAGPSGLSAALTAGRSGAQIILADEDFRMGGRLNSETFSIGDAAGADWAAGAVAELASMPTMDARTTVIGAFDHGIYGAVERFSDHTHTPETDKPRQVLWRIYTKGIILAAGATERPIAFENNDRPGIMLGSAIRSYANRFAVAADKRVAIFTNNDDGHRTAIDLHARGSRSLLLWMCGPMCRARWMMRFCTAKSKTRWAGWASHSPKSNLLMTAPARWSVARWACPAGEPKCAHDLPPTRAPHME